jgi:AraC family transcriptional regulator
MNTSLPDDLINASNEHIPAAIPGLIDAAVAAFDADRDTSRRYLLLASAVLGARRAPRSAEGGGQSRGLLSWELKRVVDYIETHLADQITAKDLAGLINASTGRLFRAFKISVGVTPLRYVTSRRVEHICTRLITTREPISQLALACGFSDQSHLCKLFRRAIGMSPSAWRRAMTVRYAGPDACRKDLLMRDSEPGNDSFSDA